MAEGKYIYTLVCLYLFSILHTISADQACDKSKCKGPVKYYEDLGCTPIYSGGDTCCAVKYNCDHLRGRSEDKCYYKGREYKIGEALNAQDAKPCDIGCSCTTGWNGAAHFSCAVVDCFSRPSAGCYLKSSFDECCAGPEVCPQNSKEKLARCEVDGKTYLDGQKFTPESDPTLSCICSEGYKGENVSPYCRPETDSYSCDVELRHSQDIYNNCTPAFYSSQNPATDCNLFSRCQNKNDKVVGSEKAGGTSAANSDSVCTFGQLTLKVGDQLNSGTGYDSVCLKCVCDVPPIPTCQRLPDDECDVTVHAEFDK